MPKYLSFLSFIKNEIHSLLFPFISVLPLTLLNFFLVLCPVSLNRSASCARWCFPCVDNIALGILLIGQSVARGDAMGKAISGIRLENVSSKESVNGGIKKAARRKRTPRSSCRGRNSCYEYKACGFGVSWASLDKKLFRWAESLKGSSEFLFSLSFLCLWGSCAWQQCFSSKDTLNFLCQ